MRGRRTAAWSPRTAARDAEPAAESATAPVTVPDSASEPVTATGSEPETEPDSVTESGCEAPLAVRGAEDAVGGFR